MSPEDYAEMTTDRLLPLFAGATKQLGFGRIFGGISAGSIPDLSLLAMDKEQRRQLSAELLAIVAALLTRRAGPDALSLFDDPDPDVRMAAALFASGLDADLAEATRKGVSANCSAKEVIAGRQRVRQGPPAQPTLQEMSDEELLARFQDAGERVTLCEFIDWVHDERETKTRNGILGELIEIRAEAARRGMLARFAPFLDSPDPHIRFQAALACRYVAPDKAVATLEALKADRDPQVRAPAGWALSRWRGKSAPSTGGEA
jgi:HEAT repeat protein